ncbi:MAG: gamma carbonic anhydrase family protein [Syntrophorhabdaceae bacterium]|nr:gamma carbonic anhydrase family protein [Syntrophorhabdaceae bacterium]MDD5244658.1 gamma carbonic anhydrase family protein [Syntrophorhabdaceae bacterium]
MDSNKYITGYEGKNPRIHRSVFIDISARVIGDVVIEEGASIWPMAVLRADSADIYIGRRSAVLDHSLIESPEGHPVRIEEEVLVSHGSIVHGAHIYSNTLIGIGAIVLEGAIVSSGSIVGAGSLVVAGAFIPPNSLVMGTPGKIIRQTAPEEREGTANQIEGLSRKARNYLK